MIEEPHNGASISFDDWRRLGNDYILVGQMQPQGQDRYSISFELYNVLNRQRLLGYQISANRAGLRLASHQVADMVFDKILGIRGAFATRIAYISVLGSLPNRSYRLIVADCGRRESAYRHAIERAADVAGMVSRRPKPRLRLVRGPAALGLRAAAEDGRTAPGLGEGGRESSAGVVAGRQEARADPVHARRQPGCVRARSGHPGAHAHHR